MRGALTLESTGRLFEPFETVTSIVMGVGAGQRDQPNHQSFLELE